MGKAHRFQRAGIWIVAAILSATSLGCGIVTHGRNLMFDEVTIQMRAISHEGADDENQWRHVCQLLNRYQAFDCDSIKRSNCHPIGENMACDYEDITLTFNPPLTLTKLRRLHQEILALHDDGVSVGLQTSSVRAAYSGLMSEGDISIMVKIEVSPGAALRVERNILGHCVAVDTPRNVFHGEVKLHQRQEWLYYWTELSAGTDRVRKYYRLNILSHTEEELGEKSFKRLIQRRR